MKFEVEIDFNYPGIENDTPEIIQYVLQQLLERGADTFNNENIDVYEEGESCTCTGAIIRTKPMTGMLYYYRKAIVPETYIEPTPAQFEDFKSIPGGNVGDVTYEQFCMLSEKSYMQSKKNGFVLAVHCKAAQYKDDKDLEKIKDELRTEKGFVGFPGDKAVEDLHTPIQDMLDD